MEIRPIAEIHSPFPEKFGIPRQSGLSSAPSEIVFLPDFRSDDAVRGLTGFDYLWLIWGFSANRGNMDRPEYAFKATVRPPRLGGNERMGVFATRSPFRPNGLGLSSVKLLSIDEDSPEGPVIHVSGADLMDGTPIYDIKPYISYADAHPDARGGFTDAYSGGDYRLEVRFEEGVLSTPAGKELEPILNDLVSVLKEDPRPAYQDDPERVYGMRYGRFNIRFRVEEGVLYVVEVREIFTGS